MSLILLTIYGASATSQFPRDGLEARELAETDETVALTELFPSRPRSPTCHPHLQFRTIIMRPVLIKLIRLCIYQYLHFRLDTQAPNQHRLPKFRATTAYIVLRASSSHWKSSLEHQDQDAILPTSKRYEDSCREQVNIFKIDVARLSNDSCGAGVMRFHCYPASRLPL